jgi:hypothetical protein
MNRLLIGDTLRLSPFTYTVGTDWTAVLERNIEASIGNLGLTEAVAEQRFRNAYILLAHPDRQLFIVGRNNTGTGQKLGADEKQ